jgi:hypothetical protein
MSSATLDRVLAALIVGIGVSGLMALKAGGPDAAWVFLGHGLLGGALFAAAAWKLRRSVPGAVRAARWRRLAMALLVCLVAGGALAGGLLWIAAGESVNLGAWTAMTVHAWLGLLLGPVLVVHLLPHRWRVLRPIGGARTQAGPSRRAFLAVGSLAVAGLAVYAATRLVESVRGGTHRFTGSRWLAPGGIPPSTAFYGEAAPSIDPADWRLSVLAPDGRRRSLTLDDLRAAGEIELTAALDCTSGWAIETTWSGVPLGTVLDISGAGLPARASVRVTSVTGWSTVLTADRASSALLATGVAGRPLPVANGAPIRLVLPDARGLDWVKWVGEVEIMS